MRQLDKKEKEICKKQINRFLDTIDELKEVKLYAQHKLDFLKIQWEFEDFAKPLERKQTIKNSELTIMNADRDIEELKHKIGDLTKQMEEGVVEKTPLGVS